MRDECGERGEVAKPPAPSPFLGPSQISREAAWEARQQESRRLLPVYDRFFEDDDVRLTQPALTGAIVRAQKFVNAFLDDGDGLAADPQHIQDLKMFY